MKTLRVRQAQVSYSVGKEQLVPVRELGFVGRRVNLLRRFSIAFYAAGRLEMGRGAGWSLVRLMRVGSLGSWAGSSWVEGSADSVNCWSYEGGGSSISDLRRVSKMGSA